LRYELSIKAKKLLEGKAVYVLQVRRQYSSVVLYVNAETFLIDAMDGPPSAGDVSFRFADYRIVEASCVRSA